MQKDLAEMFRLIDRSGLSRQALTEAAGLSYQALLAWERGTRTPRAASLGKLAEALKTYAARQAEAARHVDGMQMPKGSGIIVAFAVDPSVCNGFPFAAHVDRYRRFDGRLVDDVSMPYTRYGHTPDGAYETCLRAIRADAGPTYNGLNWRLELAPDAAAATETEKGA